MKFLASYFSFLFRLEAKRASVLVATLFVALLILGGRVGALAGEQGKDCLGDGKTIESFQFVLLEPVRISDCFNLEDGVLRVSPGASGWILLDKNMKNMENFTFSIEFQFLEPGFVDSGVTFCVAPFVPEDFTKAPRALEVQMKSTDLGDLWGCAGFEIDEILETNEKKTSNRFFAHTEADTGNRYCRLKRLTAPGLLPCGEWNHMVVDVQGETLTVRMNGQLINQCRLKEPLNGPIAIQTKTYPGKNVSISYRNARLTER